MTRAEPPLAAPPMNALPSAHQLVEHAIPRPIDRPDCPARPWCCRVGRSRRDQCRRSTAAAKPRVRAHSSHRPAEQRASILSPGKTWQARSACFQQFRALTSEEEYASAVRGSRLVTEGHATGLVALPHLRDSGLTRSFVTDRPVSNGFPARSWCSARGPSNAPSFAHCRPTSSAARPAGGTDNFFGP